MSGRRWTKATRRVFLDILGRTGNVSAAARMAGLSRSSAYALRRRDPGFAAAWRDAEEEAVDLLEAEARRRAVEGIEEPLMGGGKLIKDDDGQVVTVRKYNDRLLEFLLKAHRPERFRDGAAAEAEVATGLPGLRILVDEDGAKKT